MTFSGSTSLIIISIIIFIFSMVFVIMKVIKNRKKTNNNGFKLNTLNEGEVGNRKYQFKMSRGGNNSQRIFDVFIECNYHLGIKISKETRFDKFFVKHKIAFKIETYDAEFDKKFYISSDNDFLANNIFKDSKIKQNINNIFNRGITNLILKKGKLIARIFPYKQKELPTIEDIEFIVKEMDEISERLNKFTEMKNPNESIRNKWFLYLTIPIIILIAGFILDFVGFINYTPVDKLPIVLKGCLYSFLFFIPYIWYSTYVLRGRTTSHRELTIIFFISIIGFILLGTGSLAFLNGYMDKSEIQSFSVPIIKKYYTKSKNHKNYHVKVKSWREINKTEAINVSWGLYKRVIANESYLKVNTKKGYFGYEWFVDYYLNNR